MTEVNDILKTVKNIEKKSKATKSKAEKRVLDQQLKNHLTEAYKQSPLSIYDDDFFRKRTSKMREWSIKLAKDICKRYNIKSLVDFGCGVGSFLEGAMECGASPVKGYEFCFESAKPHIPKNILPYIEYGDAGKKISCQKFDCSLSIEVAEHLLPENSSNFVDNLTSSANRLIFFTSAPPGQGGTGHINCQPQIFWKSKFEAKRWKYSAQKTLDTKKSWESILLSMFDKKKAPLYLVHNLAIFEI